MTENEWKYENATAELVRELTRQRMSDCSARHRDALKQKIGEQWDAYKAVASERAEPTANEPEVPDDELCQQVDGLGQQCRNIRKDGSSRCASVIAHNFAPDVPSEGEERELFELEVAKYAEVYSNTDRVFAFTWWLARAAQAKRDTETDPDVPYTHCNTCGMRSHGTNAELRSQVDELRAKLKAAKDLIDSAQEHLNQVWPDQYVTYKRAVGESKKAGLDQREATKG